MQTLDLNCVNQVLGQYIIIIIKANILLAYRCPVEWIAVIRNKQVFRNILTETLSYLSQLQTR